MNVSRAASIVLTRASRSWYHLHCRYQPKDVHSTYYISLTCYYHQTIASNNYFHAIIVKDHCLETRQGDLLSWDDRRHPSSLLWRPK